MRGIYNCDSVEADQEWAEDGDHQPGPGGQPRGQLLRGHRGGREEQDYHLHQVSQTSEVDSLSTSYAMQCYPQSMVKSKH